MTQQQLIEQIQSATDARERRIAAEELAAFDNETPESIDAFVQGLEDPDKGVRDACAQGLTERPDTLAAHKAGNAHSGVAALIAHKDIEIRNLAGDILLKLGYPSAVALYTWLTDSNVDSLKFAIDIIGLVGNQDSIPQIIDHLHNKDGNVRAAVIEALGNLKAQGKVDELIRVFHQDEEMRPHILESVGKIGGSDSQAFLLHTITQDDEFLQVASIDALAESADTIEIAEKLVNLLQGASKPIQGILLKTIFSIAFRLETEIQLPDELRSSAYAALEDDDPDVRVAGLLALGSSYLAEDVPSLIVEVRRREEGTREQILSVLLLNSPETTLQSFSQQLVDAFAGDGIYFVELLADLHRFLGDAPTENVAALAETLVSNASRLAHVSDELREFLVAADPKYVVSFLREDMHAGDAERQNSALLFIRQHRLQELRSEVEELSRSDGEVAAAAAETLALLEATT